MIQLQFIAFRSFTFDNFPVIDAILRYLLLPASVFQLQWQVLRQVLHIQHATSCTHPLCLQESRTSASLLWLLRPRHDPFCGNDWSSPCSECLPGYAQQCDIARSGHKSIFMPHYTISNSISNQQSQFQSQSSATWLNFYGHFGRCCCSLKCCNWHLSYLVWCMLHRFGLVWQSQLFLLL